MPTYEYRCEACNHQFEVFASMSDPDPESCEGCGANALKKMLFPVAVHYKGSGFYSTDYSGKRSGSGSGEGSSGDSAGDSASAGTSDSTTGSSDASTTSTTPSSGSSDT